MKKEIVPWKCHYCGQEFDLIGGGICKHCGQPTCNICFGLGKVRNFAKLKTPDSRSCFSCSKMDLKIKKEGSEKIREGVGNAE